MRFLVFAAALSLAAQPSVTPKQASEGWLSLFDGKTLYGWTPEGKADWKVVDGVIVSEAGDYGWLRSDMPFADYVLKVDYRQAADGNSGIFLRSAREGQPHETGYELQMYEGHPKFPTGSIVNHVAGKKVTPAPDAWHTYEVRNVGDRFEVKLDGKTVLETADSKSKSGHFGLQHNKDKKIEFRNILVRPLGLQPIFKGKLTDGWQTVERPNTKEPAVWSAKKGMIHVEKGPGQLETKQQWQNFVLQLDIRANTDDPNRHPNSGVFFRGQPNVFWSGYEIQIRNQFQDADPAKPVDFGTGGIYHNVPTRRIIARDNEFFTMAILASGRQIATWVNGMLTASWRDPNPAGTAVSKKQAIEAAGTISLQAHDPTTNLDFKNLKLVALP